MTNAAIKSVQNPNWSEPDATNTSAPNEITLARIKVNRGRGRMRARGAVATFAESLVDQVISALSPAEKAKLEPLLARERTQEIYMTLDQCQVRGRTPTPTRRRPHRRPPRR